MTDTYRNKDRSVTATVEFDSGWWHVTVAAWSGPGNAWDVVDERDFDNPQEADRWAREQVEE